ncbi:hypothetical protein HK103_003720 [Boothiomyces macroporosus]|uniref:Tr-type G domain-containing protein n=1 Tax=Boothiomyces macroporosus TaxID=261099 RepID=A0AAD5UL58_9FUNG|nr:hypothetical protein HK103_003720 [Boothiomyces macroporosus]
MFRKGKSQNETTFSLLETAGHRLPPEVEEGNIEYKLKLVDPTPERIDHLVTQLKWRLAEGGGEAIYEIGVSDAGTLVGLNEQEMKASMETLKLMGSTLCAELSVIRVQKVGQNSVAEVLFRKCLKDDQHFLEIRVAVLGGADAGKSTLLGVLSHDEKDNGRGKARLNLLRHRHEIESGRSSSISRQIIGFNSSGEIINYATTNISTWEQICENSSKVVTFMDTCGHPKYQRTTIGGLTGSAPHYATLILNASYGGLPDVAIEQIMLTNLLKVPLFIVITKIDVTTAEKLTATLKTLLGYLKTPGIARIPVVIKNQDDLATCIPMLVSSNVVPLFLVSNVTGENINLLVKLFNLLPKPQAPRNEVLESRTEFQIEDVFTVDGTGSVVGGMMVNGRLYMSGNTPQIFYLGPDRGRFIPVIIHSVHRQRCKVSHVQAGQVATCAIKFFNKDTSNFTSEDFEKLNIYNKSSWVENLPADFKIRRGQSLVPFGLKSPASFWEVDVDLYVLLHPTSLYSEQQVMVYVGSVRQLAKVMTIKPTAEKNDENEIAFTSSDEDSPKLPTSRRKSKPGIHLAHGQHGKVRLRFMYEPEHLTIGSTVLVRGTGIKCVGKILNLHNEFAKQDSITR